MKFKKKEAVVYNAASEVKELSRAEFALAVMEEKIKPFSSKLHVFQTEESEGALFPTWKISKDSSSAFTLNASTRKFISDLAEVISKRTSKEVIDLVDGMDVRYWIGKSGETLATDLPPSSSEDGEGETIFDLELDEEDVEDEAVKIRTYVLLPGSGRRILFSSQRISEQGEVALRKLIDAGWLFQASLAPSSKMRAFAELNK